MSARRGVLRTVLCAAGAGLLLLGACSPIPKVVDTPKNGDRFTLAVEQPMQVRWGNVNPTAGAWALEASPKSALKAQGHKVEPPANGSQQLETFDFVAAQKGAEDVTFVFKRADGQPPDAEERITISVTVG